MKSADAAHALLCEACRLAGKRARLDGIAREFNPFDWVVIKEEFDVPAVIWEERSAAWLAGWDAAC